MITSTRRPIIYPSGKIIAHDNRYMIQRHIVKKLYLDFNVVNYLKDTPQGKVQERRIRLN